MAKIRKAVLSEGLDVKFRENHRSDYAIGVVVHMGPNTVKVRMKSNRLYTISRWYCTTNIIKPLV